MKSYRLAVNLKLGLIVTAVLIALASLAYTNHLANRLRLREVDAARLWAKAIEYQFQTQQLPHNPYQARFLELESLLRRPGVRTYLAETHNIDAQALEGFLRAQAWARTMPPAGEIDFVTSEIVIPNRFGVPAILVDSASRGIDSFRNIGLDSLRSGRDSLRVRQLAQGMGEDGQVIPIRYTLDLGGTPYVIAKDVYFGESDLVRHLRFFPYVQLFFVALFIFVGYMGFSYVRRHEQSNLWVGMAKEAAHQLGTPITSMMGWTTLLREEKTPMAVRVAEELDKDVMRLQRVANRFSKIGSKPELTLQPLVPVIQTVSDYIRRRVPQQGRHVVLAVEAPEPVTVPFNAELFEWVIENLLKNALDALEGEDGTITLQVHPTPQQVHIDITDTGKGIDKRQWKNVFRPGYSTKQRGWGLGLSLARRIVEDYHGGSLNLLSSRVGEGTTFRITLDRTEEGTAQ